MKKLLTLTVLVLLALSVQADDRKRQKTNERSDSEHHNYIIERQQAYQVQGVPTSRLIIGKRELDVYPTGEMFEKNHLVGVKK
jgi:hypothetical protein